MQQFLIRLMIPARKPFIQAKVVHIFPLKTAFLRLILAKMLDKGMQGMA